MIKSPLQQVLFVSLTFIVSLFSVTSFAQMTTADAVLKANALYKALTGGVPLLPSNSLYTQVVSLVKAGNYLGAAQAITDPDTGADEFYNNVVASLPQTMNQNLTAVGPRNELSAMFLVIARDGRPVDELLTADFTALDPTGTPGGAKYAKDDATCGNKDATLSVLCNTQHYIDVWQKTNPRRSLKRVPHPSIPGIGVFTSWPWVREYDTAGTARRNIKGVMENLYLVSMDAMRTTGIPTDSVRQDVPRNDPHFVDNCLQCHAWMDKIVHPFLVKDSVNNSFVYNFKDKLNDIQGPLYPVTGPDFDWFYTPAQQQILGFDEKALPVQSFSGSGVKYIHGTDLHDFANMVANSRGFYRGLVKRIVAQIYMKKLFSLAIFSNEDLAVLDGQSDTIETFTDQLMKSKDLRDIYDRIAVWYSITE